MSPRSASSSLPTLVHVSATAPQPLHRQLYASLRDAIVHGRLSAGMRLPAARTLAQDAGVSRNTAASALDQLRAEGYVIMRERIGTFVTDTLPDSMLESRERHGARSGGQPPRNLRNDGPHAVKATVPRVHFPDRDAAPRAFRTGLPALDAFPWTLWSRLMARRIRTSMHALGDYGASCGYEPLRSAIADYLQVSRGARCTPAQVLITAGAQQALHLVSRLLIAPGDPVWMEDPGFPGARGVLAASGAHVIPVPLDANGIDVAEGMRRGADARLVYVTPSHQYPTGITMSASRRLELLNWATQARAWILEDDYDSEFRYSSRPLNCLQGIDTSGRVLYVGSFSKVLFPALRLGYVVLPEFLIDDFWRMRQMIDRHSDVVQQAVVADFIAQGHFARHIRRMRLLYEERRNALLSCAEMLSDRLEFAQSDAGIHVLAWLRSRESDLTLSHRALTHDVEIRPISVTCIEVDLRGFLLGYAAFSPRTIRAAAERLARSLTK